MAWFGLRAGAVPTGLSRGALRAAEISASHGVDALVAMALTTSIAFFELRNLPIIPLSSGSITLETRSIFDVFYMGVMISWVLYLPNVRWLIGRAADSTSVALPTRRWLGYATRDALRGLIISLVALVLSDVAFQILAPSLAFSMATTLTILAIVSALFQVAVSSSAARRADMEVSRSKAVSAK